MNTQNHVKFAVVDTKAVIPEKGEAESVGYDLTAISVYKKYGEKITLFDTGICVQPPEGYYTEILPRSSLSKTGYVLANSVGLIDSSYTGSLKIALIKVDESCPNLVPPFKKCQLILRKHEQFSLKKVLKKDFRETYRGSGGFGSTDVNMNKEQSLECV